VQVRPRPRVAVVDAAQDRGHERRSGLDRLEHRGEGLGHQGHALQHQPGHDVGGGIEYPRTWASGDILAGLQPGRLGVGVS
jgi:hypothetical protein